MTIPISTLGPRNSKLVPGPRRFWPSFEFRFSIFALLSALSFASLTAAAATVTGTIKRPDGTPVNGTIEFVLSQQAKTTTPPILIAPVRTTCAVTDGLIAAGCTVQGNDTLDPAGTYYVVRVLDANNLVIVPATNYTVAGSSVDLGTLPVTATATLVPPSGNVVGNLSVTGNLTVGGSADFQGDPDDFSHLRLLGLSADPATASDGSIFHRSDLNRLRFHVRGLQLFDGTQYVDITSVEPNTVEFSGNLKVSGGTILGNSADLKCGSTPPQPDGNSLRLYCPNTDEKLYYKDDTNTVLGPLAALNSPQNWSAAQTFDTVTVAKWSNLRIVDGIKFPTIQAAHDDCPSTGCTILIPAGTYTLSSTLTITKPNVVLVGAGTGDSTQTNGATRIDFVAGVAGVDITGARVVLENLHITSQSSGAGTDDGIRVRGQAAILRNVYVEKFGQHGIHVNSTGVNANLWYFERVVSNLNKGDGFRWTGGSNGNAGTCSRCSATSNTGYGFRLESGAAANLYLGAHAEANTAGGIYINTSSNQFIHTYIESGTGSSLTLTASAPLNRVSFSWFGQPTTITNNGGVTNEIHYYDANNNRVLNGLYIAAQPGATNNTTYRIDSGSYGNSVMTFSDITNSTNLLTYDATNRWTFLQNVNTGTAELNLGSGGVAADGGGFKHARISTGSIAAGQSAAVTLTWSTAFADTNYTIIGCEVEDPTVGTLALRKHHIESKTTAAVIVRIVNDDGDNAHSGTLHCTAVHD